MSTVTPMIGKSLVYTTRSSLCVEMTRTGTFWNAHIWAGTPLRGRNYMHLILWLIAVVLVISGIVSILRGGMLWGIVLIVLGLLVGPGGVSLFT